MKNLLIILLFISCSPLQRHSRIVNKFPYVHTVDSIKLIDTVTFTTKIVESDTVTLIQSLRDTIRLVKDNLKVTVYTVRDSVYINGFCDTVVVTKIIENTVPVIHYKDKLPYWMLWLLGIICAFVIYLIFIFKKKIIATPTK